MIDIELCCKVNFEKKIIEFNSDEFTNEIKRITKEKNITQEKLFSEVEEKTGFSESKVKRWKSGDTKLKNGMILKVFVMPQMQKWKILCPLILKIKSSIHTY